MAMDCIGSILSSPIWNVLGTMALIVTLILIFSYTKATKNMAVATDSLSRVQMEELELRKRPVIAVQCNDPKNLAFPVKILNLSNVHARAWVKATVTVYGQELKMANNNPYNGEHMWSLQAKLEFHGTLEIPRLIQENKIDLPGPRQIDAAVRFETSVMSYDETQDTAIRSKNPEVYWYWNKDKEYWAIDISPKRGG